MSETFDHWAVLELMGHRKIAGHVQELQIGGASFLRLDIPTEPPATQFYSPSAVYCITPTTEAMCRALAATHQPRPVQSWELPEVRALPAPASNGGPRPLRCEFHDDCDGAPVVVLDVTPMCWAHARDSGAERCEGCDVVVDPDEDGPLGGRSDGDGVYTCSNCVAAAADEEDADAHEDTAP